MADFIGKNTKPDDWLVSAAGLREELASPAGAKLVLIDVREPSEYAQGAIEGGKLIPLGEIAARAREIPPGSDVVLYCAHGVRSMHALFGLMRAGFPRIRSLEGGTAAWEEAGGKLVRGA